MSSRDDADFWGLTLAERVHFHGRISAYYGAKSRRHGALAEQHWRKAQRLWVVFGALNAIIIVLKLGDIFGWWA